MGYPFKVNPGEENNVTAGSLWRGFEGTTTVHGVPHVATAVGKSKTLVWLVISLIALGMLSYHMFTICSMYFFYGVNVKITILEEYAMDFPAVTFCNLNPIKKSNIGLDAVIESLLGEAAISNTTVKRRKKRYTGSSPICKSTDRLQDELGLCYRLFSDVRRKLTGGGHAVETCESIGGAVYFPSSQSRVDFMKATDLFTLAGVDTYWNWMRNDAWGAEYPLQLAGSFTYWGNKDTSLDGAISVVSNGHMWTSKKRDDGNDMHYTLCQDMVQCPHPVYDPDGDGLGVCWMRPFGDTMYAQDKSLKICPLYDPDAYMMELNTLAKKNHFIDHSGILDGTLQTMYWLGAKGMKWKTDGSDVDLNYVATNAEDDGYSSGDAILAHIDRNNQWFYAKDNDNTESSGMVICEIPNLRYVPPNVVTTVEPSTIEPTTTVELSTIKPTTTVEPSTIEPTTTVELSTIEPTTTAEPTTIEPTTTVEPTTIEPTTIVAPTTIEPTTTVEPTTIEPTTTADPTTVEPTTTVEPSTIEPTTIVDPSTIKPTTTVEPSTIEPTTTVESSTIEPTTPVEPSTIEPTTVDPSTIEPTTTVEPSTTVPTTTVELSTIEPTTTAEPTTIEPTTAEPSTIEPTTVEPSTIVPTTLYDPSTNVQHTTTIEPTTTVEPITTFKPTTTTTTVTTGVPTTMVVSSIEGKLPLKKEFILQETVIENLAVIPDSVKALMGYEAYEFLVDCTYEGSACTNKDFHQYYSPIMGNCYIFNSGWNNTAPIYSAKKTGRRYGLSVILNIGEDEYVEKLGGSSGARVVPTGQNEMPHPEQDGIFVEPGKLVSIGIRKVAIERKSQPYGNCTDELINPENDVFSELYPVKYSTNNCRKTCYQKKMIDTCGCGDSHYPLSGAAFNGKSVKPCDINNITQDDCKYRINSDFVKGRLGCSEKCHDVCSEQYFTHDLSTAKWPSEAHKSKVIQDLQPHIHGYNLSESGVMERNLLTVEVFFDDFSYEEIREIPAYSAGQFASDIGGILGLWIGMSVITVFEFIELFMDMIILFIIKLCHRHKKDILKYPENGRISPFTIQVRSNREMRRHSRRRSSFESGTPSPLESLTPVGTTGRSRRIHVIKHNLHERNLKRDEMTDPARKYSLIDTDTSDCSVVSLERPPLKRVSAAVKSDQQTIQDYNFANSNDISKTVDTAHNMQKPPHWWYVLKGINMAVQTEKQRQSFAD